MQQILLIKQHSDIFADRKLFNHIIKNSDNLWVKRSLIWPIGSTKTIYLTDNTNLESYLNQVKETESIGEFYSEIIYDPSIVIHMKKKGSIYNLHKLEDTIKNEYGLKTSEIQKQGGSKLFKDLSIMVNGDAKNMIMLLPSIEGYRFEFMGSIGFEFEGSKDKKYLNEFTLLKNRPFL